MKNKNTTLTLDQNLAVRVALLENIREFLPNRRDKATRKHVRDSIQALRFMRSVECAR